MRKKEINLIQYPGVNLVLQGQIFDTVFSLQKVSHINLKEDDKIITYTQNVCDIFANLVFYYC